jgi:hypothetical protein
MKTEIKTNKYISDLERYRADICAETLLGLMRVDVDEIFQRHGMDQPPSQSHRAKNLLEEISEEVRSMVKQKSGLNDDLIQLFQDRNMLKDFLAVHRTVWILEGKPL